MSDVMTFSKRTASGLEEALRTVLLDADNKVPAEALRIVGAIVDGAIIERGSNANGEYIRWADGTQVCWLKQIQQGIAVNQAVGSMYRSETIQWTFPAQFATTMNYLSFHSASALGLITYTNVTNYTLGVLYWHAQTTADTLLWLAIGKWK